jgi:perosamine synthetase
MKEKMILTAGPSITEREVQYVLDAVCLGWNANWDGYLKKFEKAFADYVSARFAMATSSCTGALHLALMGLGVGPGDEVLVPEVSWVATASAVVYTGAKPVFVDIEPDTWCIDVTSAGRALTSRTKAIIPVHLYGHPADMDAVSRLARDHGLKVLEDAAPALGAEVHGKKVGSLSDAAVFSFQGAKIMTTGEGGMFVTSDEALIERVRFLADHGRDKHRPLQIAEIGYKYKMSNLQAALGLGQIERIEELVVKKREIFEWYRQRLANVEGLQLNVERPWARSIYWMTSVVLSDGIDRDALTAALKERGIDSRPFFSPMSSFPMFKNYAAQNPNAYRISRSGVNLPSGHNLTEDDVERVCQTVCEVLPRLSRNNKSSDRIQTSSFSIWKPDATQRPGARVQKAAQVLEVIRKLKDVSASSDTWLPITLDSELVGRLVPVTWADTENAGAIELLCHWRELANPSFPAQFPVTVAGTGRWLVKQLLEVPDRLLFWVQLPTGKAIGHLGLYRFDFDDRSVEIDNVVRGINEAPGMMQASLAALLDWTFAELPVEAACLRVLSDNERALRLYERCGFREIMRMPLTRVDEGDVVRWVEVASTYRKLVERYFITMRLLSSEWRQVRYRHAA